MQPAPAAPTVATAPAPGLGRRSPAHGRTAPSATGQSNQKVQNQDAMDTRRGETVRGGRSSQVWSAPRTITAVDRASTAGLTHSIFSHSGETSGRRPARSDLCYCHSYIKSLIPEHAALLSTEKDFSKFCSNQRMVNSGCAFTYRMVLPTDVLVTSCWVAWRLRLKNDSWIYFNSLMILIGFFVFMNWILNMTQEQSFISLMRNQ